MNNREAIAEGNTPFIPALDFDAIFAKTLLASGFTVPFKLPFSQSKSAKKTCFDNLSANKKYVWQK